MQPCGAGLQAAVLALPQSLESVQKTAGTSAISCIVRGSSTGLIGINVASLNRDDLGLDI